MSTTTFDHRVFETAFAFQKFHAKLFERESIARLLDA
jgi:hypothetical protein